MLAHSYRGENPTGKYASEKFDGVRALWNGQQLLSRSGNPIAAPQRFLRWLPRNVALDGELYVGPGAFERTASIVSKKAPVHDEWKLVKYYVFDLPHSSLTFVRRHELLQALVNVLCHSSQCPLHVPRQTLIKSPQHLRNLLESILKRGGEGLMVRSADGLYVHKRSKDLLKVKQADDAEAIVVGMIEGKGQHAGSLGALVVELAHDRSKVFKIGTGFTAQKRRKLWSDPSVAGALLTFSYRGLTSRGLPRHPSFIRFRVEP